MMKAFSALTNKSYKYTWIALLSILIIIGNTIAYSFPPEVTNVSANQTPETAEVVLSWDPITSSEYTDDVITQYRIYYGTKPVITVDDYYENDVTVSATESSYTFTDLEEGGTYYFSVTGINSLQDESITYSIETSVTVEAIKTETDPKPETNPAIEEQTVVNSRMETETDNNVNSRIETEPAVDAVVEIPKTETTPEPEIFAEPNTVQASETNIAEPVDTTPPLNPSNLLVNSSNVQSEKKVILNWNKAIDIYEDIQDQVLYTRKGLGQWDSGYSIGANIESIEIDVEHNQNYEVKIVTVDQAGNESEGITYIFSTHLAESGPNSWWSILLAMMVFVGLLWTAMQPKR